MAVSTNTKPMLQSLEERLATYNLRGQWQKDSNRPQREFRVDNQVRIEPSSSGVPHLWRWQEMLTLMRDACDAMPESYTARRSLILTNPQLARGTTHTLMAGLQMIGPGEIAWAHRHTINALRFVVDGAPEVQTIVNGRALTMEPGDLILTPGRAWHDHRNGSERPAIWLDALDVPFILGLNQNFYEELGETMQDCLDGPAPSPLFRPVSKTTTDRSVAFRYPWQETHARLEAISESQAADTCHGFALDYINPTNGGPTLPTIQCRMLRLPPGFEGTAIRQTASMIVFVVSGEGGTTIDGEEFRWETHDILSIPNWSWFRHRNRSTSEPAFIFCISDSPILQAFDLFREERAEA